MRSPDHPIARALLTVTGRPPRRALRQPLRPRQPDAAAHVEADLGDRVAMVLDGGATAHGLESTIVDARGDAPVLLRPGAVTVETIEAVLGTKVIRGDIDAARPSAPGQLLSHYAPQASVRLNAREVRPGEALLAFGPDAPATNGPAINLSPPRRP
ncbi:MAG: Sua5/YciO/YrdC/YwlC family protein [Hyphomicrobium sp.]